ncbi:DDE-type integrase/transposase/recombinase [Hymenobacter artigasi]|uniref:Transposase-like protein n=1 Tax=Hymenobacter artigasi TaxID=2719616 RepID=A0ABX1HMV0_9BACT|nr:DDE-type integrase/transposase/recombinase [Hymenobacter artigasi]NKI91576.1 transposase-like protein [Hymenobacter artigasi]
MKQIIHGNARTTPAIRLAIQESQESLLKLAERYNINPKTVAKWRNRTTITDAVMGPEPGLTLLTSEQEAFAVAFRRHTLLPLNDCLSALQTMAPRLSRSTLHRCFQRHGISRLPRTENIGSPSTEKCTDYPIGFLRVDFASIWSDKGTQHLYVAIDPVSKLILAELHPHSRWVSASNFLERVLEKLPQKVHTVFTDKSIQFTHRALKFLPNEPNFNQVCRTYGISHQRIPAEECWGQDQVVNMTHTLTEAFALSLFCGTEKEINKQLQTVLLTYNHATHLNVLGGLTPHGLICTQWQNNPAAFIRDPTLLSLGLYD